MKKYTLLALLRPDYIDNYGAKEVEDVLGEVLDQEELNNYETVDTSVEVDASAEYLNDVVTKYVFRDKRTNDFYVTQAAHDSWGEEYFDEFVENASRNLRKTEPKEVTITVYEEGKKINLSKV